MSRDVFTLPTIEMTKDDPGLPTRSSLMSIANLTGGYTSYTPTWTSTGVAPAIGNAVVVAQYIKIGKFVHAYGRITFGSTTTFGTGDYSFALPVAASANAAAVGCGGSDLLYDNSANAQGMANVSIAASTMFFQFPATYLGALTNVGAAQPWTLANGDIISWDITYEAAS